MIVWWRIDNLFMTNSELRDVGLLPQPFQPADEPRQLKLWLGKP